MPQVALLLGYCFVFLLFRADIKRRKLTSSALWIPGLWLGFLGTRAPSLWLGGQTSHLEGSPINFFVNTILILGALLVVQSRRFDWLHFISKNKALALLYSFCLFSIFWSELPVVTLKRVIQDLGNVLVPLVILSEPDPVSMLKTVYTRVAYVIFPMSVVAIRYFPAIGRAYSRGGTPLAIGLTTNKNSLGADAMLLSLVIIWDLLEQRRKEGGSLLKKSRWPSLTMVAFGMYLLNLSASATALFCFVVGLALLLAVPRLQRFRNTKKLAVASIFTVLSVWALNSVFNLSSGVYEILGREENLTGRTQIWEAIGQRHVNPFLGAGFGGFWDSQLSISVLEDLDGFVPNTAHNGYIEVFLNGGMPAVTLLAVLLVGTAGLVMTRVTNRDPLGPIALVFFVITIFNNYSESIFFVGDPLWFTQLLVTMGYAGSLVRQQKEAVFRNKPTADLPACPGL